LAQDSLTKCIVAVSVSRSCTSSAPGAFPLRPDTMRLIILLCLVNARILRGKQDPEPTNLVRFDYGKHGQDWVAGTCGSRHRQSPIDFTGAALTDPPGGQLPVNYQYEKDFKVLNNGHCIQVDVEDMGLGGITFDNAWYNLLAVNLHAAGEHTFGGVRPELELHLVHKRYDSDALAIMAIPFNGVAAAAPVAANVTGNATNSTPEEVPAYTRPDPTALGYNPELAVFTEMPIPEKGSEPLRVISEFDMNKLATGLFASYEGSLTAPPCSENVRWFVRREPLSASAEQVERLSAASMEMNKEGNWRVAAPLNDRAITVLRAEQTEPALTAAARVSGPKEATTLRESAAIEWGRDAVSQAMEHLAHVKNLDQRLRTAADAHAEKLQPQFPTFPPASAMDADGSVALYNPSDIAEQIAVAIGKSNEVSANDMAARITPQSAAQEQADKLAQHLNAGEAFGAAHLDAQGVPPAA